MSAKNTKTITKILKDVTNAKLIYVYIFGDHHPHLHIHLAPHWNDDILYEDIVKPDVKINSANDYPIVSLKLSKVKIALEQKFDSLI